MEITEVNVTLADRQDSRMKCLAFASIIIDGEFAVRDIRVVDGRGGIFVAMPSRRITDRCDRCGTKNISLARYCNNCGVRLADDRAQQNADGSAKLYVDVAHPISPAGRSVITAAVLDAYADELERAEIRHPARAMAC